MCLLRGMLLGVLGACDGDLSAHERVRLHGGPGLGQELVVHLPETWGHLSEHLSRGLGT